MRGENISLGYRRSFFFLLLSRAFIRAESDRYIAVIICALVVPRGKWTKSTRADIYRVSLISFSQYSSRELLVDLRRYMYDSLCIHMITFIIHETYKTKKKPTRCYVILEIVPYLARLYVFRLEIFSRERYLRNIRAHIYTVSGYVDDTPTPDESVKEGRFPEGARPVSEPKNHKSEARRNHAFTPIVRLSYLVSDQAVMLPFCHRHEGRKLCTHRVRS